MSKLTGGAFRRRSYNTVTVIDARVHRSSARNARFALFVTATITLILTATVLADQIHPILALFVALAAGIVAGVIAWALVRIWPVVRLLWWWLPEISLALGIVYGWTALAKHTPLWLRLVLVAALVAVPTAIPVVRRRIAAVAWCVIVRHRLRTCFAQFIIANRTGSLPLILLARPTPVGERVWIYLRPGLSLAELQTRIDKIAVACHASTVTVERASDGNAAFLRLDVTRRDGLKRRITNPLVGLVRPDTPTRARATTPAPTALDLPQVPAFPLNTDNRKPASPTSESPTPKSAPVSTVGGSDDASDWI